MSLLLQWLVTSLTILSVPYLVSGVSVDGFGAALAAAAVLGILNVIVKPILFVLTLPITVISLGLFYLVLNALMFYWMGGIVSGVHVESFGAAFLAGLCVSFISWLFGFSFKKENGNSRVIIRHYRAPGPTGPGATKSSNVRDLN